eukprot:Nk52_evm82s745 gene=Nk52_evmTU82s745
MKCVLILAGILCQLMSDSVLGRGIWEEHEVPIKNSGMENPICFNTYRFTTCSHLANLGACWGKDNVRDKCAPSCNACSELPKGKLKKETEEVKLSVEEKKFCEWFHSTTNCQYGPLDRPEAVAAVADARGLCRKRCGLLNGNEKAEFNSHSFNFFVAGKKNSYTYCLKTGHDSAKQPAKTISVVEKIYYSVFYFLQEMTKVVREGWCNFFGCMPANFDENECPFNVEHMQNVIRDYHAISKRDTKEDSLFNHVSRRGDDDDEDEDDRNDNDKTEDGDENEAEDEDEDEDDDDDDEDDDDDDDDDEDDDDDDNGDDDDDEFNDTTAKMRSDELATQSMLIGMEDEDQQTENVDFSSNKESTNTDNTDMRQSVKIGLEQDAAEGKINSDEDNDGDEDEEDDGDDEDGGDDEDDEDGGDDEDDEDGGDDEDDEDGDNDEDGGDDEDDEDEHKNQKTARLWGDSHSDSAKVQSEESSPGEQSVELAISQGGGFDESEIEGKNNGLSMDQIEAWLRNYLSETHDWTQEMIDHAIMMLKKALAFREKQRQPPSQSFDDFNGEQNVAIQLNTGYFGDEEDLDGHVPDIDGESLEKKIDRFRTYDNGKFYKIYKTLARRFRKGTKAKAKEVKGFPVLTLPKDL